MPRTLARTLILVAALLVVAAIAPPTLAAELGFDPTDLDASSRPQDDFFRYVNGKWLEQNEIPPDERSWGVSPILRDQSEKNQRAIIEELAGRDDLEKGTDAQRVGDLFASFMAVERLEALGARPVSGEIERILAAESVDRLVRISGEQVVQGIDGPMNLFFYTDLGDSTRYMIYLFQSGLTLPDRDYYLKDDEGFAEVRAGLPGYAAALFDLAGLGDAATRGADVLAVETALAEIQWPAEELRDVQKLYNLYDTEGLGTLTEAMPWGELLAGLELAARPQVVVGQPSYAEGLARLLRETPLDDLKSYFAYHVLHAAAPYLSQAFVDARHAYVGAKVQGLEELPQRWQRGVRTVNGLIGEAVGRVYVERHFPPEAKRRMEEMVQNLVAAFGAAIDEIEWMTAETKAQAQAKRAKFNYKIGYPDKWRDYSALTIDRRDLLGNVMRAAAFEHRRQVAQLDGPIDRTEWGMTPQTVNAYHSPGLNEIVFPAAILQAPMFDLEADPAVNYGAIGAVIGHEIGHAFDDQGRKFDGDGNLRDWWTAEDAAGFEAAAAKLVGQYDAFSPLEGMHVNGKLTLGENIGDLTGVTVAWQAYLRSLGGAEPPVIDGFTGAQRFFIGYAQAWRREYRDELMRELVTSDPHSPPEFRVIGPLRNAPHFYETFDVKQGDGMWLDPDDRVRIW
jgi:predicted metalloendopeptidase